MKNRQTTGYLSLSEIRISQRLPQCENHGRRFDAYHHRHSFFYSFEFVWFLFIWLLRLFLSRFLSVLSLKIIERWETIWLNVNRPLHYLVSYSQVGGEGRLPKRFNWGFSDSILYKTSTWSTIQVLRAFWSFTTCSYKSTTTTLVNWHLFQLIIFLVETQNL